MPHTFGLNLGIARGGMTSIASVERAQLERYMRQSRQLGLPPRCPIANVYRCPRFFLSLAVIHNSSFFGRMTQDIEEIREFWKQRTTIPPIEEEEPEIDSVGSPQEFLMASNFCPEVSFRFFGVFASFVARWGRSYDRQLDKDDRHSQLRALGAEPDDWRWVFSDVAEKHYTECEEWPIWRGSSTPSAEQKVRRGRRSGISAAVRWEVFDRDNYSCQYCGRRPPKVSLELDHRIPLAKGGTDDPANLLTSCHDCNTGKRDKVVGAPRAPTE